MFLRSGCRSPFIFSCPFLSPTPFFFLQVLERKAARKSAADAPSPLSAGRTLRFAAVGLLWVGPLLSLWHQAMEHVIPGAAAASILKKVLLDQFLQGPFMISSMYLITGASGRLADGWGLRAALRDGGDGARRQWRSTWVQSLYVWSPVQALQQAAIPLQHRVLVANVVAYVWNTYLAMRMAPGAETDQQLQQLQQQRQQDELELQQQQQQMQMQMQMQQQQQQQQRQGSIRPLAVDDDADARPTGARRVAG